MIGKNCNAENPLDKKARCENNHTPGKWLARRIILTDLSGKQSLHELSIVSIDPDGRLNLSPFSNEMPGVSYSDIPLNFKEISPDCWIRIEEDQ